MTKYFHKFRFHFVIDVSLIINYVRKCDDNGSVNHEAFALHTINKSEHVMSKSFAYNFIAREKSNLFYFVINTKSIFV